MNSLIILVKNPIAGKTKTRLAASVGNEKALRMYRILMEYTQKQAAALNGVVRHLLYSNAVVEDDMWPSNDYHKGVQSDGDLGERMLNAFKDAFAAGAKRVVIIGSDCPGVTTELLQSAFAALEGHDVVIGPALDGGYYLLGMNVLHSSLFDNIAWSTAKVASQTKERAATAQLTIAALEVLSDVDYLEDWERYGWPIPN